MDLQTGRSQTSASERHRHRTIHNWNQQVRRGFRARIVGVFELLTPFPKKTFSVAFSDFSVGGTVVQSVGLSD